MGEVEYTKIREEILRELPVRKARSNKGTYGKVLCIAGSVNMAGAAYLCGYGAYRAGVGLVRVLTPKENRVIIQELLPEAVLTTFDREYLDKEKEILLAQAKQENPNKPDNIIEKMIVGRLNKELKEVCLLEQVYVKAEDGKQTVAQYLAQVSKENGTELCVKKFVRFETGEGIEKKQEDFAAEVAAQMNA